MENITPADRTKQYDDIILVHLSLDDEENYFVFVNKNKTESHEVSVKKVISGDLSEEDLSFMAANEPSWTKFKALLEITQGE